MSINTPLWINLDVACTLLKLAEKTVKEKCRKGDFIYKVLSKGNKRVYQIKFESLPRAVKNQYLGQNTKNDTNYSNAPVWAKAQADKYITIIKACEDLKGLKLREFIKKWNIENEKFKTSYSCLLLMRKRYNEFGISGLLAKYGHTNSRVNIKDKYFDYFKNLYLKEGAPSLASCWELTLGFAIREDRINKIEFPTIKAILEKNKNIEEQSIIEKIQRENLQLRENSEEIQKQAKMQLNQKEIEINDLKRQLYESQSLANKYINIFRKSFFNRLFNGLKKADIEKDMKLLS